MFCQTEWIRKRYSSRQVEKGLPLNFTSFIYTDFFVTFDRIPAVVGEPNQILTIETVLLSMLPLGLSYFGSLLVHFSRKHDGSVDIFTNYPKTDLIRSNIKAGDDSGVHTNGNIIQL